MERAVVDYDRAVSLERTSETCLMMRFQAHRAAGDQAGLRADLDRALALRPTEIQLLLARATFERRKATRRARSPTWIARSRWGTRRPAHWQRGLMREMLASEEDYEALRAALADYDRAHELGADAEDFVTARAALREKLGAAVG